MLQSFEPFLCKIETISFVDSDSDYAFKFCNGQRFSLLSSPNIWENRRKFGEVRQYYYEAKAKSWRNSPTKKCLVETLTT